MDELIECTRVAGIITFFYEQPNRFMVDFSGDIYKTTTGGTSWAKKNSGTNLWLNSVFFTSANTGFIAGGYPWSVSAGGIILRTTDAGNTWNSTIVSYPISSVYFADSATGYAVGTGPNDSHPGIILKTTDGGITWDKLTFEPVYAMFSVFFTDPNTGYIAGDGNRCYKTTDGGLTWNYMQMPVFMNRALRSVCFPTRNTGYITGDVGYIFKTFDSGNTWTTDSSGTSNYLTSVFFTDSITGYVVGSGGTILKKGHGGEPYLSVLPSALVTGPNAGSASFLVTSNTNWKVFSDSSWCTVTPSGLGNDTILASYTANASVNPRVDTIRVYTLLKPFLIKKIVLVQEGISGIESINRDAFRIYPNPSTDKINLRDVCPPSRDKTVSICTITGKIVSIYKFLDQDTVEIDIGNLARGIYLVKVQTDSGIAIQKLVIN